MPVASDVAARIKCRTSVYKLFMLMVRWSGRLIAVGEVVIAFTRMQLRGFNDDATRLIAFIFARDTYVMKKTMERESERKSEGEKGEKRMGVKWTTGSVTEVAVAFFCVSRGSLLLRLLR